jgi:4-amino-4-deoxy-L-arabinose transferase-like glycosyltransferase
MQPTSWRKLAVLLLIAFALRLAVGWAWQARLDQTGQRFGMGDTESYWSLGKTIAFGLPYEYGDGRAKVFRAPGYPILLSPIFRCTADGPAAVLLARAEAALLGTLAVLVLWWLTRLIFDDRAAFWAAVFAAFYPGAIVLGVLLLSEAPFCPLMLLQLAFWTLAWQSPTRGRRAAWSVTAGLAAGAATLMRPSWLMFTPFALAVGLLSCILSSKRRHDALRHAAVGFWMLLGLMAAMSPWWIRNACVTGRFIPTTLQVGASLYDGISPEATGASNMDFVKRFEAEDALRKADSPEAAGGASREMRLDRRMHDEAAAWAKANPGAVVRLVGVKFLRMWNVWPNEPQLASNRLIGFAIFFTYTPLLVFAIIGAWRTIGLGWPYILCWLPAVYLTLLHVVFVSSIRYRDPAMLALLALAAGAWCWKKD